MLTFFWKLHINYSTVSQQTHLDQFNYISRACSFYIYTTLYITILTVCISGIYLTMVMVMTGISIVISVIVLDLHHHEATTPVPKWLRRLVFGCMGRLMCVYASVQHENSSVFQIAHGKLRKTCEGSGEEEERLAEHMDGYNSVVKGLFYDDLEAIMAPRRRKPMLEEILQHLRDITTKMKRNIKRDQVKEEWKLLAKIIDRFLLVIFLLAITTLTVSILYFYPELASERVPNEGDPL